MEDSNSELSAVLARLDSESRRAPGSRWLLLLGLLCLLASAVVATVLLLGY